MSDYLHEIRDAAAMMTNAHQRRNNYMRAARESGATWRTIALAAGMTEHGVRHALTHTAAAPGPPDTAATAARATDQRAATYQESMRTARDARDKLRAELTAAGQPD